MPFSQIQVTLPVVGHCPTTGAFLLFRYLHWSCQALLCHDQPTQLTPFQCWTRRSQKYYQQIQVCSSAAFFLKSFMFCLSPEKVTFPKDWQKISYGVTSSSTIPPTTQTLARRWLSLGECPLRCPWTWPSPAVSDWNEEVTFNLQMNITLLSFPPHQACSRSTSKYLMFPLPVSTLQLC